MLSKAIGCWPCFRTTPTPPPEASHSTTKGLEKSSNDGTTTHYLFNFLEGLFSHFIPLERILLSQISEWRSQLGESFHKLPIVCTYSNEASYIRGNLRSKMGLLRKIIK